MRFRVVWMVAIAGLAPVVAVADETGVAARPASSLFDRFDEASLDHFTLRMAALPLPGFFDIAERARAGSDRPSTPRRDFLRHVSMRGALPDRGALGFDAISKNQASADTMSMKIRAGWMPWMHPWGDISVAPDVRRPFNQAYRRGTSVGGFLSIGGFVRPWFVPEVMVTRQRFSGQTIATGTVGSGAGRFLKYPDATLWALHGGLRFQLASEATWYDITQRDRPLFTFGPVMFAATHLGFGFFGFSNNSAVITQSGSGAVYENPPGSNKSQPVFLLGQSVGFEIFQVAEVTVLTFEFFYQYISSRDKPDTSAIQGIGMRLGLVLHF